MKRAVLVVLLAAVALSLMAGSAFAATSGVVNVDATVNSAVSLTVTSGDLTFGPIDPGTSTPSQDAAFDIITNMGYRLTATPAGDFAADGFTRGPASFNPLTTYPSTGGATVSYTDPIVFSASWAMDPALTYSSFVTYDVIPMP